MGSGLATVCLLQTSGSESRLVLHGQRYTTCLSIHFGDTTLPLVSDADRGELRFYQDHVGS